MAEYLVSSRYDAATHTSDHFLFVVDDTDQVAFYERTWDREQPHPAHVHYGSKEPRSCIEKIVAGRKASAPEAPDFMPGEYIPRVWRGHENPPSKLIGLQAAEISCRRVVDDLCARLTRVFWYAEPDPTAHVFSHELRS